MRHETRVNLWREPGVEDLEPDHRRQRLTVAVLCTFAAVMLGFAVAWAIADGRRLESAPCGKATLERDGSVIVFTCEGP